MTPRDRNVTRTDGRGVFVALVGPDGTGKTTVAEQLTARWDGPTTYVHFRPPLRAPLARRPSDLPDRPMPKTTDPGPRWLGWLRLVRSLTLFWAGYWCRLRPALRNNGLVVADRWGFGYIGQPAALRFAGPNWLGMLAVRLLPEPDVTVNLTASVETIRARKAELQPSEIAAELDRWATLPVRRLVTVDAERPASQVADSVVGLLMAEPAL